MSNRPLVAASPLTSDLPLNSSITSRALYAEFQQVYPGEPCGLCHYLGFSTIYFYKQLIETAGSINPDDVMKVLDDPSWMYEWWGQPGRSLGRLETFGIRRVNQDETVLTRTDEICQKVPISRELIVVPWTRRL